MSERTTKLRCAIYTRKSTDEGLDQAFNSLDAQREACEAYIASQAGLGWRMVRDRYDDGGLSGGTMERPALQRLLDEVRQGRVDVIVVYKIDRLTRSLMDFARMVEIFDGAKVSFVSVTQQFNTTTSMGRLTLNVLLSFAQFEREVARYDRGLIEIVAKAHAFRNALTGGHGRSRREIADRFGVRVEDISRLMPLAFLSPRIVDAILAGRQPVDLTAQRLSRGLELPMRWDEQETLLGF